MGARIVARGKPIKTKVRYDLTILTVNIKLGVLIFKCIRKAVPQFNFKSFGVFILVPFGLNAQQRFFISGLNITTQNDKGDIVGTHKKGFEPALTKSMCELFN